MTQAYKISVLGHILALKNMLGCFKIIKVTIPYTFKNIKKIQPFTTVLIQC